MISGCATPDDERRAIEAGLRFMCKPVTVAQFGAMMAQVGERAEAPREGGQASPNTPPPAKPGRYRRLNPVWLVAVPTKVQATKVQLIPLGNRNILVGTS